MLGITNRELTDRAVALARTLQQRAADLQTSAERRQQAELDRMLQNPGDKAVLVQLTDQAFRSRSNARIAGQFTHILDVQGIPRFFSPVDRALLRGFQTFGGWLPGVSVPLVQQHLWHETANVVLPAEAGHLRPHLLARRQAGLRMNVNFLGEALLGEHEAQSRMGRYLEAMQWPEVEVLSVKISTLYSQISPLAREHTLGILADRLERLYREAAHLRYVRADGTAVPKFVYLDMEEYRDLELTAEVFLRTLERPGLETVSAGIALQAYLPDSIAVQRRLTVWAKERIAKGGGPVTIRIVKGANLEMERVEGSLRGWPQAPYQTKRETDAMYQRMLREAISPENLDAVRIGVASHNLFDVAHGLVLAAEAGAGERVQFEMLEGMANHQRRALHEVCSDVLLYAPACRKEDFLHAVGYLLRRLDENTGPENFLRHAFRLEVDGRDWQQLAGAFRQASTLPVSETPRRTQNRAAEFSSTPLPEFVLPNFENEADTDFSLLKNSVWACGILDRGWAEPIDVPLMLAGRTIFSERETRLARDPSCPARVLGRVAQATVADVEEAIQCAAADSCGWRGLSHAERSEVLGRVAAELRSARGDLLHVAVAEGGKTIAEADPEVSEAVDFVEYYRASAGQWMRLERVTASPLGVVVVVPPWNFPIAIPCGGIAAALAAGNTVILKPASDAALIAWRLCECFWRAGVPGTVLQFLPCPGSGPGARLAADARVNAVIFTGGTATGMALLQQRPEMRLFAETGGKNAMIITGLSDRELAIKHAAHSAFSHGGQKCSATSLLLLEAEVYDDPGFKRMLVDAVESMVTASAWRPESRIGPLIRPPSGELEAALMTLEPGESWALMPERDPSNPHLWTPGIKWGVQPGSVTHRTEFFGPVLGVMRYRQIDEAIEIVNATGYGLTSGIHSLDEREIALWREHIAAGNLYVNKPTVGAIVLRQPFGGWGKSVFGPGMKAGGPNYIAQLSRFDAAQESAAEGDSQRLGNTDIDAMRDAAGRYLPAGDSRKRILAALVSYDHAMSVEFSVEHDDLRLLGEDNIRLYRAPGCVHIRLDAATSCFDAFTLAAAARVVGNRVVISYPTSGSGMPTVVADLERCTNAWAAGIEFEAESAEALAKRISRGEVSRLRTAGEGVLTRQIRVAAAATGSCVISYPPTGAGRLDLLWCLREQAISHAWHRYGNLGPRASEPRREPK
jgi:RHH-type proline utilization regulon transcriptional repressor/proline dehydrogenase/delta 1-pyrroline-5-carboxylate dehydrogenase